MNEILYKLRPFTPYIILAILVFIAVYFLNKRNKRDNFITSSEHTADASGSKYMLINQATGKIMFSEANGATITNRITKMEDQLELLLGTTRTGGLSESARKDRSLNGFMGSMNEVRIKKIEDDVVKEKERIDAEKGRINAVKDEILTLQPKSDMANYIYNGNIIALGRDGDNGCGGRGCRAVTGFKARYHDQGKEPSGWASPGDIHFGHTNETSIKIWKQ